VDSVHLIEFFKDYIQTVFGSNPDVGFLALAAGFEGVLLAVAIPLSFSMVSNISEKFESDLITERFLNRPEIRFFPPLLVTAILFSFILTFADSATRIYPLWKVGAWIAGVLFLFVCIVFARFIDTVRRYITDVQNIIEELLDDAEKAIK
jgi:phosphoglycerol transferase MdoB-like AlkP superfamily enzyme